MTALGRMPPTSSDAVVRLAVRLFWPGFFAAVILGATGESLHAPILSACGFTLAWLDIGVRYWVDLSYRCARRSAVTAFVAIWTLTFAAGGLVYVVQNPSPALLIPTGLLGAATVFGGAFLVRATGGPEPGLVIQYRLRKALDSMPAAVQDRELLLADLRSQVGAMAALRSPATAPVIDAVARLAEDRFSRDAVDTGLVMEDYDRLEAAIFALQRAVGKPPSVGMPARDKLLSRQDPENEG